MNAQPETVKATMSLVRTFRKLACDYTRKAKAIDAMAQPTRLERRWRDEYIIEAARLRRIAREYFNLYVRG